MTDAVRFPAEWEPQSAVLIAWPHASTDWAPRLGEVEDSYIALVAAITRFQPVLVCVADADLQTYVEARLRSARIDMARVRFIEVDYDDTWLRDSGPVILVSEIGHPRIKACPGLDPGSGAGSAATQTHSAAHPSAAAKEFTLLDFRFSGWGGKFAHRRDDALTTGLQQAGIFQNTSLQRIDFELEGGAIETDGAGTLLSTWQCLHQRHPQASREILTLQLAGWLQQDRVLWLHRGYLEGDDTDAHIDTLARFAGPDAIVFQACDDQGDTHYPELQAMAEEIAALRTKDDKPYRLFPLPWVAPIVDQGRRLAASYANFLIINGAVLMPAYGIDADDSRVDAAAAAVLKNAFPDREIVMVPCRPLIWQNGSLHCLTMQLPEGLV